MRKLITISFIAFFYINALCSDIITLNNQMSFAGKVTKIKDCTVYFKANRKRYAIPATDINCIEFGEKQQKVYLKYLQMKDDNSDNCLKGKSDAEELHGRTLGNIFIGLIFPVVGIVGCIISKPNPQNNENVVMHSKNKALFTDPVYLKCYEKEARGLNIRNSCLGTLIAAGILLAVTAK